MKTIGRTTDGWVVEISSIEMAKLLGYTKVLDIYRGDKKLEIGDTVEIGKLYDQLNYLSTHQDQLGELAAKLVEHAEKLVLFDPIIKGCERIVAN